MHTMNTPEGVLWFNTRSNQLEIFFKGEWQPVHPTALVDRENGLLFTGHTFYDDNIWLFVPESNIDDYSSTIDRLVDIESATEYLFGAHSSARVDAGRLSQLQSSLRKLRSGKVQPFEQGGKRLIYVIDGITFVTAKEVLDGRQGDITIGGSGFGSW